MLHCEFQLSTLSSSEVLNSGAMLERGFFPGGLLHCESQLSILRSSKVLFWGVIRGFLLMVNPQNLVRLIVSQTSYCIMSFNFLCWAV